MVKRSGQSALSWIMLLAVIGGVVLYASGFLAGERIAAGDVGSLSSLPAPRRVANAETVELPTVEQAVGTVQSRRTVTVSAQLPARVISVEVQAGARVQRGDVLATLDDSDVVTRLAQAKQAVAAAEAGIARARQARAQGAAHAERARLAHERVKQLLAERAATQEQLEAAHAAHTAADAAVAEAEASIEMASAERERATQSLREGELALSRTRIVAPQDGVVAQRAVEAGDLAWPGRALVVLLDPRELRFEAQIREGLLARIEVGQSLEVRLDSVDRSCTAAVAEILPMSDPRSRTFEVRLDLDAASGARPGMFGRLQIVTGKRASVLVPAATLVRVGQLDSVVVEDSGRWVRRMVTLGATVDDGRVEVLSGLRGGERVALQGE